MSTQTKPSVTASVTASVRSSAGRPTSRHGGRISRRARGVVAHSYGDFPVTEGQIDLRGDTLPPLRATAAAVRTLSGATVDVGSYGEVAGHLQLRHALGELFGVEAGSVVITVGGSEALHVALTCITDAGQRVLLPRPAFPGFDQLARLLGLRRGHYDVPGPVPTDEVSPLVVCTPHNPTGAVTRRRDVAARAGWTIWDVSHACLAADQLRDIRAVLASSPTAVVVFSLSKLLRLPGARVGALLSTNPTFISAAVAVKTHLSMSVGQLAQSVATTVLTSPDTRPELAERQAVVAERRAVISEAAARSRTLTPVPAADGTHVWIRVPGTGDAWGHLSAGGVVGLPGPVFNGSPDTVRLCIAQPADQIHAAAQRLVRL